MNKLFDLRIMSQLIRDFRYDHFRLAKNERTSVHAETGLHIKVNPDKSANVFVMRGDSENDSGRIESVSPADVQSTDYLGLRFTIRIYGESEFSSSIVSRRSATSASVPLVLFARKKANGHVEYRAYTTKFQPAESELLTLLGNGHMAIVGKLILKWADRVERNLERADSRIDDIFYLAYLAGKPVKKAQTKPVESPKKAQPKKRKSTAKKTVESPNGKIAEAVNL